ncbi:MAG: GTPase HflX [Deltaproteobacteria bacterium]|nr:GTPase HflX [Deltaproteobacteria bacterium]
MAMPSGKPERTWLVWVRRGKRRLPGSPADVDAIAELASLVEAAGGVVAGFRTQTLTRENPATVIGTGAIEALREDVRRHGVDLVVFQNLLKPKQQQELSRALEAKVLDRREVILDIFAQRARSREGKLQVELAQLSFRLGRLAGTGKEMSRPGGGIGTRGPGEKKLEEDRRRIRTQVRRIERELRDVRRTRALHYRRRRAVGFPVVSLVGYTNAGKSTLFNRLTGASVFVADRLFATLDPTARRLPLPGGRDAILVDTVGFVHDLPAELLDAFLATLEGIGEADLLVHVADGSATSMAENVASVDALLAKLGFSVKPTVIAVNKRDLGLGGGACPDGAIPISAATGEGIPDLLEAIRKELWVHGWAESGSTRLA